MFTYTGLCHYRRKFDLSEKMVKQICNSDIDLIITTPIINVPNVKYMYGKNHFAQDWEVLGEAIDLLFPDYKAAYTNIGEGHLYIPYNMVIMRRQVLEAYCEWAFPIFQYIENHTPQREEDSYQRRNIGFLSERIMSVYFKKHWNDYNIVLGEKNFYE